MTAVAHDEHHHASPEELEAHDHKSHDRTYVLTALFLAGVTALETATYFFKECPVWHWGDGIGVTTVLLVCMFVKFITIAHFFMHLKYDSKLLSICFYSGLILAVTVYIAVMTAFRLWWSGSHMVPVK